MAEIIECPSFEDPRGTLTVLEKVLPFSVKRVYWMTNLNDKPRGQHRHKITRQALMCLQGSCEVMIEKNNQQQVFQINQPNQALLLEPEDWHELRNFQHNAIVLLVASHAYDPDDYIKEPLV